ncbi:reverse transcriptase domain-containing protein [Tanacetum coccineum]|uniref:Reverse transcriptase domain-containing protein n=1 Tax=Tanacetum coccineum TaxID=301880 RepID=A0ABQ5FW54_9ASTR
MTAILRDQVPEGVARTRCFEECSFAKIHDVSTSVFQALREWSELTQWFERMETVFRISNCSVENQIKFSTCTLLAGALTWWNSHVRIVGHDVAYAMTWIDLRKKMNDQVMSRNEIKKLEAELWNLKVKGTDVTGYNQRFQELALLCVRMFPEESDKVERYVGGLPDMIHGIGKLNNNTKLNNNFPVAGNVVHALRRWDGERNEYVWNYTVCQQVQVSHNGPCTVNAQLKRVGHLDPVSPWKGVVRFGKRGKLNPRDAGPFKALARVEALAYKLSCLKS